MTQPYTLLPDILSEVPDIPDDGILSRTVFKSDAVKAVIFAFDSGQELSEHTAAKPAILHFLQGEADLTLGADHHAVKAGSWLHMEANLPHSVVAKTPLVMLLLLLG
jgi:quercetin dioxygenase-like cupin family protein